MWSSVNILMVWALILIAIVAANGKDPYDHQTTICHDLALTEVWIGRAAINIGNVLDKDLYDKVRSLIPKACNDNGHRLHCNKEEEHNDLHIETSCVKDINSGEIGVSGQWTKVAQRDVLWDGLAIILQMLSISGYNCYDVQGHGKFCNAPDFIRINMPNSKKGGKTDGAWMRLDLSGDKGCRSGYGLVKGEFLSLFDAEKQWSRDVKCLIYGSTTCGSCGSYCDACGFQCRKLDCPTCSWGSVSEQGLLR
ncbi:hypothetical protein HBH70_193020 [Parastagonospora nodorum]|nr:hypothetical protein HBI10_208440 [Parastagonospora nodorum]KAH4010805.1 hypothetical protein HBI13_203000 [Parastagonospora nodorum]KAH4019309.1 hypothetical protein HBI09_187740 [Parastagonospora nodorum]KAH4062200.1 hypothetical protein HBH50_210880 [Parastagonospora nodorum]KAH4080294.1 hypothetical protein HBH48_208730 [Parastagonospora nodorum]